jgi:hypothetical protein
MQKNHMPKNHVQNIIVHDSANINFNALSHKINAFYLEIIERRLNHSNLTAEEKISVINMILDNLKSREINGIIK